MAEDHFDIEQIPSTKNPEERDTISRLKVNAKSLRLFCRDLVSFIDQAEKEAEKNPDERDNEKVELVKSYFERMYAFLARISNDITGHGYTGLYHNEPLKREEIDRELYENLKESFRIIEESLQAANRNLLFSASENRYQASTATRDLFPFSHWLEESEDVVRDLKRMFRV